MGRQWRRLQSQTLTGISWAENRMTPSQESCPGGRERERDEVGRLWWSMGEFSGGKLGESLNPAPHPVLLKSVLVQYTEAAVATPHAFLGFLGPETTPASGPTLLTVPLACRPRSPVSELKLAQCPD